MSDSLNNVSRATRRKYVRGGTWICSHCDQKRIQNSAFCREHHNEYHRDYARKRLIELKELRARVTQPLDGDALSGS